MRNKQPTSRKCFVCGRENPYGLHLNFYETGPGEITAKIVVPDQFQGYPGIVHGGIIAAILDEVTGRVFMQGDPDRFMVTAKMQIRYRRPVPIGIPLEASGHARRDTGMVAEATGKICNLEGEVLAEAEAYYVAPPKDLLQNAQPSALGWLVIPDEGEEKQ